MLQRDSFCAEQHYLESVLGKNEMDWERPEEADKLAEREDEQLFLQAMEQQHVKRKDTKMIGTDEKGTASSQDRGAQHRRDASGGNKTTDYGVSGGLEQHGQKRATRIAQGGQTGKNSVWGFERGSGNTERVAGMAEKHGQKKDAGRKSVGGKVTGSIEAIPSNVRVNSRQEASGNSAQGDHENSRSGKAQRVTPDQRFESGGGKQINPGTRTR